MDLLLFPISAALLAGELAMAGLGIASGVAALVAEGVLAIASLVMGGLSMLLSVGVGVMAPAAFHVAVVAVEVVWTILVTVTQVVWGVATLAWGVIWGTLCVVVSLFGGTVTSLAAFFRFADELMWIDGPYGLGKLLSRTPALPTSPLSWLDVPALLQSVLRVVTVGVWVGLGVAAATVCLWAVSSYVVPVIQNSPLRRRRHSQHQNRMRNEWQTIGSGRVRRTGSQRANQPSLRTTGAVRVRPPVRSELASAVRVRAPLRSEPAATCSEDSSVGSNLQQRVRQLEVELENSRERSLCVVCLDQEKEILLKPCNHLCVCSGCQEALGGACPVCRAAVQQAERVFQT